MIVPYRCLFLPTGYKGRPGNDLWCRCLHTVCIKDRPRRTWVSRLSGDVWGWHYTKGYRWILVIFHCWGGGNSVLLHSFTNFVNASLILQIWHVVNNKLNMISIPPIAHFPYTFYCKHKDTSAFQHRCHAKFTSWISWSAAEACKMSFHFYCTKGKFFQTAELQPNVDV